MENLFTILKKIFTRHLFCNTFYAPEYSWCFHDLNSIGNYISYYNFKIKAVIIKRIWSKIEEKLIKIIEVFKKDKKRNCLILLIYILKGFNVADNFRPEAKFTVCKQWKFKYSLPAPPAYLLSTDEWFKRAAASDGSWKGLALHKWDNWQQPFLCTDSRSLYLLIHELFIRAA